MLLGAKVRRRVLLPYRLVTIILAYFPLRSPAVDQAFRRRMGDCRFCLSEIRWLPPHPRAYPIPRGDCGPEPARSWLGSPHGATELATVPALRDNP